MRRIADSWMIACTQTGQRFLLIWDQSSQPRPIPPEIMHQEGRMFGEVIFGHSSPDFSKGVRDWLIDNIKED